MTRAQRRSIDRLKKKHRCTVVKLSESAESVRVKLLDEHLPEDERERLIRPSGLVEEPADLEDLRGV